jgi:hypothetical protein
MIIGISGKIGSGKDTLAMVIKKLFPEYDFQNKKFASKIKQITSLIIGCSVEDLENRKFKNTPLGFEWNKGIEPNIKQMTPRLMLQLIGTECGRDIIHPNIWVNALFSDYIPKPLYARESTKISDFPNWIISDVRFPNEAKIIKEYGGILVRIERTIFTNEDTRPIGGVSHTSETALDDWKTWDVIIGNNGTIKDLEDLAENALKYIL